MSLATNANEQRVLLLTPTGKDSALIGRLLGRAGCAVFACRDVVQVCQEIGEGAAVLVLAEEGLSDESLKQLTQTLDAQPAWSDLPLIVLTMSGKTTRHSAKLAEAFKHKVNHAFLERPLRMLTLVSAVRTACRARERQYEIRGMLEQSAEEIQKRDQFIAMLGHELRNPLAAVRASVEIMNRFGCNDPSLIGMQCDVIDRQSKHMSRLVDDLLDVARLNSGRVTLSKCQLDLRDSIRRSVESIKMALRNDTHAISLELPKHEVRIEGDPVRLEQVFGNLLSNSIRYSPSDSKIEIKLEVRDGTAFVRVKDEGEGIEPELLPTIFEPFVQSSQTLARVRGGLGLGLTVVRNLVELHGGAVSVSSPGEGAGSEFTVTLPVLSSRVAVAAPPVESDPRATAPKRILLVEDNADARESLALLLTLLEYEVFEAADGQAGLDKLIELRPDVALIDIGLPELSGYEVATRARQVLDHSTFMIALTGYGQSEDRERALAAGFDAHLVKPVDLDRVTRLISRATPSSLAQ